MAYSRSIPSYALYGDEASPAWSNAFNFEWIPQRSALYQWTIQPHRHEAFLQLLYLTQGQVHVQIDDAHADVQAPCLLLIPAGHVHGFRFSPDIDGPVVTATQKTLESLATASMPELLRTIRKPCVIRLQPEARYVDQLMPLFCLLEQESRSQAPGQIAAGMSLLQALLVQVHRLGDGPEAGSTPAWTAHSRKAQQIERFRTLVDRDFRQHHGVQAYAAALGVSPGQLSRLCREVLGMSSLDVINARLVHEAQRELVYTTLSIQQLAAELGFEDDAYFSRFFRRHTGLPPRAFRAQALSALTGTTAAATGPTS